METKKQTFEDRLTIEKLELSEKCYKLDDFMGDDNFDTLPETHQFLLHSQFEHMSKYLAILRIRIELLEKSGNENG